MGFFCSHFFFFFFFFYLPDQSGKERQEISNATMDRRNGEKEKQEKKKPARGLCFGFS
jgi:hypothetical protein